MKKRFRPQKDITAYELAIVYGHVIIAPLGESLWNTDIIIPDVKWWGIPPEVQRHFQDAPPS